MSEVGTDGIADDGRLGLEPTDAMSEAVELQSQESTQGQTDVVALRLARPRGTALHLRALFDPPMIGLYRPAVLRVLLPSHLRHRQFARGPVGNVAVWGDYLVHLDQTVTDQPDY